jgi:hypothetical protein
MGEKLDSFLELVKEELECRGANSGAPSHLQEPLNEFIVREPVKNETKEGKNLAQNKVARGRLPVKLTSDNPSKFSVKVINGKPIEVPKDPIKSKHNSIRQRLLAGKSQKGIGKGTRKAESGKKVNGQFDPLAASKLHQKNKADIKHNR